jgi:hypothetical protein
MVIAVVCLGATTQAQTGRQGVGRGFGFRDSFGRGINLLKLTQFEAVQEEVELGEDKQAEIKQLAEKLRAERSGERPDFDTMSEDERETFFAELRERRKKETETANSGLAKILTKQQMDRLTQISLQLRGVHALTDPEVAKKLDLSDDQQKKITEAMSARDETIRKRRQELLRTDRDDERPKIREELPKLRKEQDEKVFAVLNDQQKQQFEKMKGEPFEMPEGGSRRGRSGGAQGRSRDRSGDEGPSDNQPGESRNQRPPLETV